MANPRLGVFKFASCDGCQLNLLNCEDELLAVVGAIDVVHFPEASSSMAEHGPFDVTLVEGSVSTPEHEVEIRKIREVSGLLVSIGACATAGGIQALRNWADAQEFTRHVYAHPEYISSLERVTPISDHVKVDFELRGCPINKEQLLELITALLVGRKPGIRDESVCLECKRRGIVCVAVATGEPCLGPVTHTGCGAICPEYRRACFGCHGPRENANTASLARRFLEEGRSDAEIVRLFRGFTGYADAFREESERHE